MSLKKHIDDVAQRTATKIFRDVGFLRRAQNSNCGGLATVKEIKDGKYIVELADGTRKEITPSGPRGVGPGGVILLSGDIQVF